MRPGEVLADRFHVERVLGEGPGGVVVDALDGERRVALRVILAPVSSDVLLQADGARKLRGEHVARVLEVGGLEDGSVFVVTEWVDGEDLASVLASRGPLPAEEAAEIAIQICDALAEAHCHNLLHGHLEPRKITVGRAADGAPRVTVRGFDLGHPGVPRDPETRIGAAPWTWVRYAAPETMSTTRPPDAGADVWSLGAILYEMACGQLPFAAETVGELVDKLFSERFERLASRRPELPRSLVSVAERSLYGDLERRCQDVSEISAVLATIAPRRARPIAARIERRLHGTLPSLQRMLSQEAPAEPPQPVARTVSRPPPSLVRSVPPPAMTPASEQQPESEPPSPEAEAPPPAEPPSSLNARVVGGVALAGVIAVGGALALRGRITAPPGVGVTQPTSASHDAGAESGHGADAEPMPVSSGRPAR